ICQNGQARRAALLVGLRESFGIEVFADDPFRGACFLDLRNQPELAVGSLSFQPRAKAARRRIRFDPFFQHTKRRTRFRACDFIAFVGRNFVENRHETAREENATTRASTSSARPVSIASAASAVPDFRSSALPAITSAAVALSSTMSRNGD